MLTKTIEAHGREIILAVSDKADNFYQFRVAVSVDGKERWSAYFTDKSDQEEMP